MNIVTDTFPALALAVEPADEDVMHRPPRNPQEAILSGAFFGQVSVFAVLITASTLAAFRWALSHPPAQAVTISFMTLSLAQIFHLGNARSQDAVATRTRAWSNPYAIAAVVVSVALQVAPAELRPLGRILHVDGLGIREWSVVLAMSMLPAVVGQALRLAVRRG